MKTSSLIGKASLLTGFYVRETFSVKGSKKTFYLRLLFSKFYATIFRNSYSEVLGKKDYPEKFHKIH